MMLTARKKRRRKLAQIRYLVACWKGRHLPYGGTLATCVLAGLAFALLWRRYRRAWQAQASSCHLAAMLTEIESVRQRLASDSPGPEDLNR